MCKLTKYVRKRGVFWKKLNKNFTRLPVVTNFNSAPTNVVPATASQMCQCSGKLIEKKSKQCVIHRKVTHTSVQMPNSPFFLPGSKNSLGLLWRPAHSQLAPWLLWSWPPVWAPARWSPPRPPRWSPSILSFSVWWRLLVLRGKYKMTPWTWTMNNCCWS